MGRQSADAVRVSAAVRRQDRRLTAALVLSDSLVLLVAVGAAGLLRLLLDRLLPVSALGFTDRHLLASLLFAPVMLLMYRVVGLYDLDGLLAGTREYELVAHAATYAIVAALALSFFAGGPPLVSRSWLLLVWALSVVGGVLGRFAIRRWVRHLRRRGWFRKSIVIVGASTYGVTLAEQLRSASGEGIDLGGFLDEYLPLGQPVLDDVKVIGRPDDLVRGEAPAADEFVLVPQALPYERMEAIARLMATHRGPRLRIAVGPLDLLTNPVRITERGSVPLVTLHPLRFTGLEGALKRALDVTGSMIGLALVGPLSLFALLAAWATGVSPLLVRVTIRTVTGPEELWLLDRSVSSSPLLRGAPAFAAVLAGRMSLVGPRPQPDPGDGSVTAALWLATAKPGLTGPWRLGGPGADSAAQEVRDLTYVRHYSIWEDVRILLGSVWRMGPEPPSPRLARWQPPSGSAAPGLALH